MPEKIMICIPSMDTVPTLFCQSLVGLEKPGNTPVVFSVGSLVYEARNKLAEAAMNAGAEKVLFIDSDMAFEPDFLKRMEAAMDESGADMVSAMCWRRKQPYECVQYETLRPDPEIEGNWLVKPLGDIPDGIQEIEGCGFGGVLIKTELIDAVTRVWGRPFDPTDGLGEDLTFCNRAKILGAKIVCDGRIRMGHIGLALFGKPLKNLPGEMPVGNKA